MALSPLQRLRVAGGRPAVRALIATPFLRRRLARGRTSTGPVEGEVVDEEIAALLGLDDRFRDSDVDGREPAAARATMAWTVRVVDGAPVAGVSATEQVVGGVRARLYVPDGLPAPSPGIVFYHGGGWVAGDLDTHDRLCRRIASVGRMRVVAVDYRLAPEHRFPAAVDDAVAAFAGAAARAARLGLDPARLGVAGDSAGGNLSAVVARRMRGAAHRPAVAGLIYAAVDATLSSPSHRTFAEGYFLTRRGIDWYLRHYTGGDAALRRHPDLSPLLADDVGGVGRTLVYTAHFDPLRDEAEAYAARLAEAGVAVAVRRFPTLVHGFAVMGGVSRAAAAATDEIARELGNALRG
ncbi:MAG TPA: alpha/beta hydrolase [Haliangiales bacterium]|nr:alpha/beta hydrolase [Haliangiales bacterium]